MKIAVIAGSGMGGTEKAACLFAAELSRRGHQVDALTDAAGCRVETFTAAGCQLRDVKHARASLRDYFEESQPDVIHNHTSGYGDHRELYQALDDLGSSKPKLIETNVFGRLSDRNDKDHVAMRMFVSMASGCQAFLRPRVWQGEPSQARHTVLYNPLPPVEANGESPSPVSRDTLGIPADSFVLVRVGRPGNKWTTWECEAFHSAFRSNPKLRLILMEPPANLHDAIRAGRYGPGILVLAATSDHAYLDGLYRLSDAKLHASSFGESYGYTIAEGMREGLPVITRTTPWADNAQVELVAEGVSGIVCCSVAGMARAILELAGDPQLAENMGRNARQRVSSISSLAAETDLLEEVLRFVVSGHPGDLMKERFEQWMNYRRCGFRNAEWNVHERKTGHFGALVTGRFQTFCRRRRAAAGSLYRDLRAELKR